MELQIDDNNVDVNKVLAVLQTSELIGEKVLRDREEIVQMDRIRNKNREALTTIKRHNQYTDTDSIYLCVGNMFIKHRVSMARKLMEDDQKNVNEHIEKLRRKIKHNVQSLQEMEDRGEEFEKFTLNPLSQSEMRDFNTVLKSIQKMEL